MTTRSYLSAATLLAVSGVSHAALTTGIGPVAFGGTASVTATGSGVTSATNSNNNATAATVSSGQFDPAAGVLLGVDISLNSSRTQTIQGGGNKNNGPGRTANGSGTSTAALAAPGLGLTFTPALSQTGTGCSLAQGPTGPISCGWGPNPSTATTTNGSGSVNGANLDDYVGTGSINTALTLPNLQATTTLSSIMGQAGSGSNTTYSVAWNGSLETSYTYLLHAAPSFDGSSAQSSLTLDFGTVTQGASVSPLAFGLFNLADVDRAGLDLDSVIGSGDTGTLGTDLAAFSGLAQGDSNSFSASIDTSLVGLFSAQYVLNLSDADVGASSTRGTYQLTLNLLGNVTPVPVPAALWLFGSALAGMGIIGRRGAKAA